ncbi:hypothetical protein [Oceanospirillum maris]|uniref:hypothetical protein n=1 Tax=Oceanospirillum maris TaxID=64977 RepID=UPI000482CBB0|nr:hypothetical protein [Oceanospirillum maris]
MENPSANDASRHNRLMQEYRQKERSAESAEDLDDAEDQTISTPDNQDVAQEFQREDDSSGSEITMAADGSVENSDIDTASTLVPRTAQPVYDQDLSAALEAFSAEATEKIDTPKPVESLVEQSVDSLHRAPVSSLHQKPKTFSFGLYFPQTFVGAEPEWMEGQSRALQLKGVFDTLGLSFPPEPSGQQFAARV